MDRLVIVYGLVKEFLSPQGVTFVERDVVEGTAVLFELDKLGAMTTPVTLIKDEIVIGFDRERLNALSAFGVSKPEGCAQSLEKLPLVCHPKWQAAEDWRAK